MPRNLSILQPDTVTRQIQLSQPTLPITETQDSLPLLVTYEEAARLLGGDKPVSVRHIERLVTKKDLRAVGRSRARRIRYQSILDYIDREAAA